ncbi:toll/interleukin-1 receptor-like protein [Eucalyptus grandis]|uniref:toll/interleukin-1 receptor-like protein n=1 Tax=Eucalyptus grandis TaxID=71139 RepID=UPI00192EB337|nr:toll/interleukin-1 receptor-like protein [Eucalyptus grandis]
MANSGAGSHGDAAQETGGEYQVFLNFRGSDTRHGFTDFLYRDLIYAGVRVFRDEDELHEGEGIGDNLLHAINHSILYISIFSHNYASSKWCIHELALMTDIVSKSQGQKSIYPIFFDVEPKDVKLKTPLYSDALLEHEKKFPVEVNDWRKALEKVDEIKGWNVKKDQR